MEEDLLSGSDRELHEEEETKQETQLIDTREKQLEEDDLEPAPD